MVYELKVVMAYYISVIDNRNENEPWFWNGDHFISYPKETKAPIENYDLCFTSDEFKENILYADCYESGTD